MLFTGCATIGYYGQSVKGHMSIWMSRQDIEDILHDKRRKISRKARTRLKLILDMRNFASRELGLPKNYSFRSYANIGRKHVVWNVVAAPELSLKPKRFCFLMMGCLSYKGYFAKSKAQHEAHRLKQKGFDVYVAGVTAYSTLGWFADPVLSSFFGWPEEVLSGVIFHELAHQVVYIKGDTAFNESFATAVEEEGIRRWMMYRKTPALIKRYKTGKRREAQFIVMILKYRARLKLVYAGNSSAQHKRAQKKKIIAQLRLRYLKLKKSWGDYNGYDKWMSKSLNNAKLASVSTYHKFVPAFRKLLKQSQHKLPVFYKKVSQLEKWPIKKRHAYLRKLLN